MNIQKIPVDIIIKQTSMLTEDYSIQEEVSIVLAGGKIIEIGNYDDIIEKYQPMTVIQGKGKLAMPGFVDGHTHISQQLLRGKLSDEYPVLYLRFNLPYENKLSKDDMRVCTELSCLEMIKSGITTFADAGADYLYQTAQIIEKSGMRAAITRPSSDQGAHLPSGRIHSIDTILKENEELYRSINGMGEGRIKFWFQFRSIASCSDKLIISIADKAREYNTGIHTHISEYPESNLNCLRDHGMRELGYLEKLKVLGPSFLAAHCIQLSDTDIHILQRNDVKVVHCPRSNLGKAVTKTPQLLGQGISVGFGTDGTAHSGLSMFREMTAFRHSQIVHWGVPYCDYDVMDSKRLMSIATMGGARALQLSDKIGSIVIGKQADIILIDIQQPHISPTHNLLNTLTEAVETGDIKDVIIDGKIVMRDRKVLTLDEERILFEGNKKIREIAKNNNW